MHRVERPTRVLYVVLDSLFCRSVGMVPCLIRTIRQFVSADRLVDFSRAHLFKFIDKHSNPHIASARDLDGVKLWIEFARFFPCDFPCFVLPFANVHAVRICNGRLAQNDIDRLVVFDRRVGRSEFINIGPGTAPQTWKFIGNAWFDVDGNRKPRLPGTETGSIYQVDPRLAEVGKPTMRMTNSDERLKEIGARAPVPRARKARGRGRSGAATRGP